MRGRQTDRHGEQTAGMHVVCVNLEESKASNQTQTNTLLVLTSKISKHDRLKWIGLEEREVLDKRDTRETGLV